MPEPEAARERALSICIDYTVSHRIAGHDILHHSYVSDYLFIIMALIPINSISIFNPFPHCVSE